MRSLNTHLPRSTTAASQHATNKPLTLPPAPEATLLSEFKAAALSVTNLYKSAFSLQDYCQDLGYSAALNDLLAYLDAQYADHMTSELLLTRRWISHRLAERMHGKYPIPVPRTEKSKETERTSEFDKESDDDSAEKQEPEPESSPPPIPEETPPQEDGDSERGQSSPIRMDRDSPEIFTFRSHLPTNHHRAASDGQVTLPTCAPIFVDHPVESNPSPAPGFRSTRLQAARKRGSGSSRIASRPSQPLGTGAGQKRKVAFTDFFDIGDSKEGGNGGGKRGRTS